MYEGKRMKMGDGEGEVDLKSLITLGKDYKMEENEGKTSGQLKYDKGGKKEAEEDKKQITINGENRESQYKITRKQNIKLKKTLK